MAKTKEAKDNPRIARREAILALSTYLKKHKLDPEKNWAKDPVHGPKVNKYYQTIRIAEEKIRNQKAKLIKPEVHQKVKTVTKTPNIYNYPDIDGKPMSTVMKKKYRAKMRALLKAKMDVKKAEAEALKFAYNYDDSKAVKQEKQPVAEKAKTTTKKKAGNTTKKKVKKSPTFNIED